MVAIPGGGGGEASDAPAADAVPNIPTVYCKIP